VRYELASFFGSFYYFLKTDFISYWPRSLSMDVAYGFFIGLLELFLPVSILELVLLCLEEVRDFSCEKWFPNLFL
jgi:hypothetical protein